MLEAYQRLYTHFLTRGWQEINRAYLQERLQLPTFEITRNTQKLGSWNRETRTLAISATLLTKRAEVEILEVLKHEMAHQYADEVLQAHEDPKETAHGSAFRHACRLLGIEHHARFTPKTKPPAILTKIRKLLALADSQNQHEAEAAMAKARALIHKYEINLGTGEPDFFYQYLGEPMRQRSAVHQLIARVLSQFFNVQVIWIPSLLVGHGRTVWLLEVSGTATNLEIAEYVYVFLDREVEVLWQHHRLMNPGLKGKTPKRDFQIGVIKGLIEKLERKTKDLEAADSAEKRDLVHLRQSHLTQFFQERHPQRRTGRGMRYRESSEFQAGFKTGQRLELRNGVRGGRDKGTTLNRPKTLGSGRDKGR